MTNLVERLRKLNYAACNEAADEIGRLRELLQSEGAYRYWEGWLRDADAEIERLRKQIGLEEKSK